jgi:hypothetical protein
MRIIPVIAAVAALGVVCAPVAAAAPNGSEEHCHSLRKTIDSFGPNDDGPYVHHTHAQFQIHCLGSAGPSVGRLGGLVDEIPDIVKDLERQHHHEFTGLH